MALAADAELVLVVVLVAEVVVVVVDVREGRNELGSGEALLGRAVGTHGDVALLGLDLAGQGGEELLLLVLGDVAVHGEVLGVGPVLEAVLDVFGDLVVDLVVDERVAPQLQAAVVDEGVEHPVEEPVGGLGVEVRDDGRAVLAHVVADVEDGPGVAGVVVDAGRVLAGDGARADEDGGVADEQLGEVLVLVQVDGLLGLDDAEGGHGGICSLGGDLAIGG